MKLKPGSGRLLHHSARKKKRPILQLLEPTGTQLSISVTRHFLYKYIIQNCILLNVLWTYFLYNSTNIYKACNSYANQTEYNSS